MKTEKKKVRYRGKGQSFERWVCRELSTWVSCGKVDSLFWRSSQSGGRATTLQKKGKRLAVHAGDIAAIEPGGARFISTFFVECKRKRSMELDKLFYRGRSGGLRGAWEKCQRQAESYGKVPMLIFKENARAVMVVVPFGLGWTLPIGRIATIYDLDVVVWSWEDFSFIVKPKQFIMEGERYASACHGRPASNRPNRRRVSL